MAIRAVTESAMDVYFVSLPFTAIERPLISFGLLQAILKKENIKAATLYYNLDFAEKIGPKNYHAMSQFAYILFGEWVFSPCLFPDRINSDDYLNNLKDLFQKVKIRPLPLFHDREYLFQLRNIAHNFLKEKAEEVINKYDSKIIACSSIFDNHIACVSFLKFIKEISPETITMIGGPNCEGEMGKTTHKLFPFIDYVVSGYADQLITVLCKKIFTYGKEMPVDEVPEQVYAPVYRGYKHVREQPVSENKVKLNELPVPDYNEYFNRLYSSAGLRDSILPAIPIESSRGCYWGRCKFCGLNSSQLEYSQKDWEQVYDQIATLTTTFKTKKVEFVDNAINFKKLSGMFDKLIGERFDLQIFTEVRVTLKKEQLRKMKEAGVIWIQPGIESLNDNFLNCMNKGSTMLQNIQIMKWARQYGISIVWTIIHNFPFEKEKWYSELGDILPLLVHLQPPRGMTQLRFDRFSDYYQNQSKYGLELNALEIYSYIYPYDQQTLNSLVYFFEDKRERRTRKNPVLYHLFGKPKKIFSRVNKMVDEWMKSFYSEAPSMLKYEASENKILIHDSRPTAYKNNFVLSKLEGEILLFSDEAKSFDEINTAFGSTYKITDIENASRSLIDKKIALKHEDKLLALAVEAPVPRLPERTDFPCGTVLKDS